MKKSEDSIVFKNRDDESGIILLALIFILVIMVFGYVVINSISKSREAEQIKESASDAAQTVNEITEKATDIIN